MMEMSGLFEPAKALLNVIETLGHPNNVDLPINQLAPYFLLLLILTVFSGLALFSLLLYQLWGELSSEKQQG